MALFGLAAALVAGLTGCGNNSNASGSATGNDTPRNRNTKVGILLPDTASSQRWVSADPNELNKQCIAYQLTCYVDNANGSANT